MININSITALRMDRVDNVAKNKIKKKQNDAWKIKNKKVELNKYTL